MDDEESVMTEETASVAGTEYSKVDEEVEEEAYKPQSYESILPSHAYQIKPNILERFKASPVKEIIRNVQSETLLGKQYSSDNVRKWTINIANEVNARCRELKMPRYKHIVQVTLGELKGAGLKSGVRCLWDSETDGYTSEIFMNDTIFCLTVVFAVYLY